MTELEKASLKVDCYRAATAAVHSTGEGPGEALEAAKALFAWCVVGTPAEPDSLMQKRLRAERASAA